MIISEKQIIRLIQVAQLYTREVRLTDPIVAKMMEEFINEIHNQQSSELKVIE